MSTEHLLMIPYGLLTCTWFGNVPRRKPRYHASCQPESNLGRKVRYPQNLPLSNDIFLWYKQIERVVLIYTVYIINKHYVYYKQPINCLYYKPTEREVIFSNCIYHKQTVRFKETTHRIYCNNWRKWLKYGSGIFGGLSSILSVMIDRSTLCGSSV